VAWIAIRRFFKSMMQRDTSPVETDIVLVGAGHAHVQVLRAFGMNPIAGVRITIVTDRLQAPYSGMLPGCIAGDYTTDEIHIDIARLARATGARLIHAAADGVDRLNKRLLLKDRPPLAYDLLSINVGITPELSSISGAAERSVPVKPIAGILGRLERAETAVRQLQRPAKIAVVGGGAAGIELAIAIHDRNLRLAQFPSEITLYAGAGLAPTLNASLRQRAARALQSAGIAVVEGDRVVEIKPGFVLCKSGRRIPTDVAFVSTNAKLPAWLTATDLPKADNGGVAVEQTLQVVGDANIFAAGDCATMVAAPRVRAGVFAVRQGPYLARNLMAKASGQGLKIYKPQADYLTILRIGHDRAIAGRGAWFAVEGQWVWRWKDRIDRAFMAMFAVPDTVFDPDAVDMRCGGCAAKVGPDPLAAALSRLPPDINSADVLVGLAAPDDAAVINWSPKAPLIASVDQFRAFISDTYLFGRIAANHALNDVYAMGGTPHHALALAVLPHGKPEKVSEELFQLLAGARATLDAAKVPLVGGHSSEGEGLALGFSVAGRLQGTPLTKRGGVVGDKLILTKPIGTGIVFAADMRAAATSRMVEAMLAHMVISNAAASVILRECGAKAATDVSGFGLGGHLAEMLGVEQGARLEWASVPLSDGVSALAERGFTSSLLPENRRQARALTDLHTIPASTLAILFDPQTAGGLLAIVPAEQVQVCLGRLKAAGYEQAADIGCLTGNTGILIV
jgi:selenide, water dikinase